MIIKLFPAVNILLNTTTLLWLCVQTYLCKLAFVDYMLPSIILGYLFFFSINLMYHRHLSHSAFTMNRFPRFVFMLFASLALQGPPRWWTSKHLLHHKRCDRNDDPHSTVRGKWYAFLFWLLDDRNHKIDMHHVSCYRIIHKSTKNFEYDVLENKYMHLVTFLTFMLYICFGAYPVIVWFSGSCISRLQVSLVNAFCHDAYVDDGKCHATNNIYLWPFLLGANWHKNHHEHPTRINLQEKWYQIDVHYWVYRVFRCCRICFEKK